MFYKIVCKLPNRYQKIKTELCVYPDKAFFYFVYKGPGHVLLTQILYLAYYYYVFCTKKKKSIVAFTLLIIIY